MDRKSLRRGVKAAFTLIELLVVIAIIAILAALLLPVLSKAKQQGWQVKCLAGIKQMQLGWQMYADDYKGIMLLSAPLNLGDPTVTKDDVWCPTVESWGYLEENTNIALFQLALLGPYEVGQTGVYKCPGDVLQSQDGNGGWTSDRIRSRSMNSQMGQWYLAQKFPGPPPGINFSSFRIYQKVTDVTCPSPAMAFIFTDETMFTMDDGYMQLSGMTLLGPAFPNAPAHYHCGGASFSFADGHAEAHEWRGPVLPKMPYAVGVTSGGADNLTVGTDPDWLWLYPRSGCELDLPAGVQ